MQTLKQKTFAKTNFRGSVKNLAKILSKLIVTTIRPLIGQNPALWNYGKSTEKENFEIAAFKYFQNGLFVDQEF